MAKAKALDKRRKSIKNIRKITRTMELVSTAQFRRAMERAVAAESYTNMIVRLVRNLTKSNQSVVNDFLCAHDTKKCAVLFILTANRGMCGGYNSGVLRTAYARLNQLKQEYEDVEIYITGKRGISYLKYMGVDVARTFTQFDDKPVFDEIVPIANELLNRYRTGGVDRLDVVYSKFVSLSKQYPTGETILPFSSLTEDSQEKNDETSNTVDYEYLPSCQSILEEVVPNAFKTKLYKAFLDAAVSEQIARMMAMRAATDNADQMISALTTTYNRARQSQITNEIIEVISGASALQ